MPSIETAVMVAIGALVMLFGWKTWTETIQPGVTHQAGRLDGVIGAGGAGAPGAPGARNQANP